VKLQKGSLRRLGSLEAVLLGFERESDLPGREIPQRYFDRLRRREGRLMADVFEPNRLDFLSLPALTVRLAQVLDPDGGNTRCYPADRLAAARLFLARRCRGEVNRLLHPFVRCASQETARDAARQLSTYCKRAGQLSAALTNWEEMAERNGNALFALIELAKWCEHHQRDFARAPTLAGVPAPVSKAYQRTSVPIIIYSLSDPV